MTITQLQGGGVAAQMTKRASTSLADGQVGLTSAYGTDVAFRTKLALPVTTTRWRLKVRNYANQAAGAVNAFAFSCSGVWAGAPTNAATPWPGTFSTAPNNVLSSFSGNAAGDQVTTPWVSGGGDQFLPGIEKALSMGFTVAGGVTLPFSVYGGSVFYGAGAAASAGNTGVPTGSAAYAGLFDIVLEYEFVTLTSGGVPVVFFAGDSLTAGAIGETAPFYAALSHQAYPGAAGLQHRFCAINAAVGGSQFTHWPTGNWKYGRFDLSTTVPDYGHIALGYNDIAAGASLATLQSRFLTELQALNALGINRITASTITPAGYAPGSAQEVIRVGFNNWLRLLPYGIVQLFDFDKLLAQSGQLVTTTATFISGAGGNPITVASGTGINVGDAVYASAGFPAGEILVTGVAGTAITLNTNPTAGETSIPITFVHPENFGDLDFWPIAYPHPTRGAYARMASLVKFPPVS